VVAEGLDGESASNPKVAVEVTAEDLADEEWGPVKEKKKKEKKGQAKKSKQQDDEEEKEKTSRFLGLSRERSDLSAQRRKNLRSPQRKMLHHKRMATMKMRILERKFSPRRRRRS
jgi:hypothetical protein